jgi:hypothetical protein
MNFKELTVTLFGTLWDIKHIEIEHIDVLNRWEEENGNKGWIKIEDFPVSDDQFLDIFFYISAPNGTKYDLEIRGVVNLDGEDREIGYTRSYKVIKGGTLYINFSENINDLLI